MPGTDALLARADAEPKLPRLGGMARPNGVVIASSRFWAFATTDGRLYEGATPNQPSLVRGIPLVRGLVRLGAAMSPLFRGRGVAGRRERLLLVCALLAPFAFFALPHWAEVVAGVVIATALLGWLMRGRTLRLHGAEHRAIAAVEERRLRATWEGTARPTRFALRCGTNFAVLVLPVAAIAELAWPLPFAPYTPVLLAGLTLAVTMELWLAIEGSGRRLARTLLLPGLGLQRVTTREPTLEETRIALHAAASVLRRELA
ncbi:MAG: DUF1385 domain-containing protein [Thermoleophilia bacterium]|nr:DUF1385 domain-containing protein [Thermoleophilia bacterium]